MILIEWKQNRLDIHDVSLGDTFADNRCYPSFVKHMNSPN